MITPAHVRLMARYNQWQNRSIYGAAATLTDADRRRDQGAFFGSIHGTLNHLLWGDRIWMHRFAGSPPPAGGIKDSGGQIESWEELERARDAFDGTILGWAEALSTTWLEGTLTWHSGAIGREVSKPAWLLATHFFNHQTHHRGQVHAMLTRLGAKPEDTDLMFLDA